MTQDQWFVINGVHHQGPFALNKLKQMARESDFTSAHRFWRPGMKESIDRDEFFRQHLGIGLPQIPQKESFDEISLNSDKKVTFDIGEFFSAANSESTIDQSPILEKARSSFDSINSEVLIPEDYDDEDDDDLDALLPEIPVRKFSLSKFIKFAGATTAFIILIFGGYYSYKFFKPDLTRVEGLRINDHRDLLKCYQKMGQACYDIALTKDYSKIFLVTNKDHDKPRSVNLVLTSKSDNNFSLKKIVLRSTATIKDKTALFELLEFEEGVNLVPGIYELTLTENQKVIYSNKDLYLGLISKVLFLKQIKQIKSNMVNKRIRPWRELEEKYQTLAALLLNIRSELKKVLFENKEDTWKKRSEIFDEAYRTKFGGMFTMFVLKNDDSKEEEESTAQVYKKEVLAYYSQLETLAKSLGRVTVETIGVLREINESNRENNQKMLLKKYQDLETLITNKKNIISAKVLSLREL